MRLDRAWVLLWLALIPLIPLLQGCVPEPLAPSADAAEEDWFRNVGSLDFPTSAGSEAQHHFLRGVAILHSFGWKQAIEQFQKAQEIEPDFAMAFWGEALCYNHPLLPERDVDSPRAVLARLGPSPEERAAKAPTAREKGFLAAVEALFGEGDAAERRIAYMEAMERLYEAHPEDQEVAAFYSLSLLGAIGPLRDDTYRVAVKAGALAQGVFAASPDHPGAAHYVIHAFDDPIHAPLALEAAHRFAEIAPAVSHARHMPSHIFIQHGMWEQVSKSNDSAFAAAVALWEPGDSVADMVHSLDWGQYGDLQRGDLEKAKAWMEELDRIVERSESARRAVRTVPMLRARLMVETDEWEVLEIGDEPSSSTLLVTGVAAARAGDLETARRAEAELAELASRQAEDRSTFSRGAKPDQVMHRSVAALIRLAEGRIEAGLALLDEGVVIAESMGPPRGAAFPVKPIHELYGEVLLELDRPAEAVERFRDSLLRTPNRARSLLGLARAHAANDERPAAAAQYRKLLRVWQGREGLAGLAEAQAYLGEAPS